MGYEVNNCCFCISVRDSVFILGYLKLFAGLTMLLVSFHYVPYHYDHERFRDILPLVLDIQGMYYTVTSLLLIVGGHKRKLLPIRSYYWISIVYSVLALIAIVAVTIMSRSLEGATCMITFGFEVYFIDVIRSYYVEMKREQEKRTREDNVESRPIASAPAAICSTGATAPTAPAIYMLYDTTHDQQ